MAARILALPHFFIFIVASYSLQEHNAGVDPVMHEKRHVASFLPYRVRNGDTYFYLQKREMTRTFLPGLFAMFGGGFHDGETPEQALRREIKEELDYEPKQLIYFSKYEVADGFVHIFMEEVGDDFESKVRVLEGEYGAFIKRSQIRGARKVALLVQLAVVQICHYLGTN